MHKDTLNFQHSTLHKQKNSHSENTCNIKSERNMVDKCEMFKCFRIHDSLDL